LLAIVALAGAALFIARRDAFEAIAAPWISNNV
jgi:hypothetical protein